MLVALALGLVAVRPGHAQESGAEGSPSAASDQAGDAGDSRALEDAALSRSLEELGAELGSEEAAARVRAFDVLRSIPVSRVDEVEARLRDLRLHDDPPSAAAYNTLQDIRHHMGSQRADDAVDLSRGARELLGAGRTPSRTLVQVAERMALLRALEGMDALAADRVMIGFFQRGWSVWQWEARHLVGRRGLPMLAALIEGRSAGNPEVRRWAVGSIRRLGVDSVGAAVQMASQETLPDVLRAYASLSDLNAMPAVITFVDHPDPAVRAAAREATASYERNAIWQLRLAHRNKLGENADLSWSWQTTMERLFDALDARRLAPANELLDEGLAAAASEDWETMHDRYERALRREPLLPRRAEMGPGYAAQALGRLAALEDAEDTAETDAAARSALTMLRRAIRLAPEHASAGAWQASVAFHEAERARRAGLLDEGAYQEVLALQPAHAGARAVLADVEDGGVGEVEAPASAGWARGLFVLGLLLLVPYGRLRRPLTRVGAQLSGVARRAGHAFARTRRLVPTPGHAKPQGALVASEGLADVAAAPAHVPTQRRQPLLVPAEASVEVVRPWIEASVASPATATEVQRSEPSTAPAEDAQSAAAAAVGMPSQNEPGPFKKVTLGILRLGRRLALFVQMLMRRVWPRSAKRAMSLEPGPLRRAFGRTSAWVSSRLPVAGRVVERLRTKMGVLGALRLRTRTPRVSLRELAETFTMMLRAEPPPAAVSLTPAALAGDGTISAEDVAAAHPRVAAHPSVATVHASRVLDAESIASEEAELDALLFGQSQPGLEPRDETFGECDSQRAQSSSELDSAPGHDSGTDLDSDPGFGCDSAPGLDSALGLGLAPSLGFGAGDDSARGRVTRETRHAEEALPAGVLETLARLARDTSPGTLDAPDTLPG